MMSLFITSCSNFRPKPDVLFKRAQKDKPYDVIIVPGVPFNGRSWDTVMKGRVLWASYLIKTGMAKNVIFSGGSVYSPYIEGKVFAKYAMALGVPKEKIFIDSLAQHSTENVYYSYHLAKKLGFKKIAIATDPFQSAKLMGFTKRRFKTKITHIPIVADSIRKMSSLNPEIDASDIKIENFKPITATQSWFHMFKGTLGKNIKFEKE
jgi:vancomycin permeability regulator SanA